MSNCLPVSNHYHPIMTMLTHPPLSAIKTLQTMLAPALAQVDKVMEEALKSQAEINEIIGKEMLQAGGKRIRPLLTLGVASWFGGQGELATQLAATTELIHTATLFHDDVIDASLVRRGKPSANAQWGNTATVLVGDFLLAQSFRLMVQTTSQTALQCLSDVVTKMIEGELMQLELRQNRNATQEGYVRVITSKTAQMFAASAEFGGIAAGCDDATMRTLKDIGLRFGLCFQIIDDILDYQEFNIELGKPQGQDLREGKPTLPWFMALKAASASERERMLNLLAHEAHESICEEDVAWVMSIIRNTNSIDRCYEYAYGLVAEIKQKLMSLPPHDCRTLFVAIVDEMIDRRH